MIVFTRVCTYHLLFQITSIMNALRYVCFDLLDDKLIFISVSISVSTIMVNQLYTCTNNPITLQGQKTCSILCVCRCGGGGGGGGGGKDEGKVIIYIFRK